MYNIYVGEELTQSDIFFQMEINLPVLPSYHTYQTQSWNICLKHCDSNFAYFDVNNEENFAIFRL